MIRRRFLQALALLPAAIALGRLATDKVRKTWRSYTMHVAVIVDNSDGSVKLAPGTLSGTHIWRHPDGSEIRIIYDNKHEDGQ